jgi:CheY-like chemotaxis protein
VTVYAIVSLDDQPSMPLLCLIAEDSAPVTHYLKSYAEMCGFQVLHVTEGESVLNLARRRQLVVILLNTQLPGKVRGWEVLHLLKADQVTCQIPVVGYCVGDEEALSYEGEGADAWFRMPVLYGSFCEILVRAGVRSLRTADPRTHGAARRCTDDSAGQET